MLKFQLRVSNGCVIWTRVSTAKQEENGGSLDYQKQICERYAQEHGLNIVWQNDAEQKPFGGTHESAKVPGDLFKAMIKRVKKDTSISKIICSEFDRFSRDAAQAIGIIRELYDMGVVVYSVKHGFQTDTKDHIMIASNLLLMATWDNDKRTDKFYSGRKHCYEMGAYTGVLPAGYVREGKSINAVCKLNDVGRKIAKAFRWKIEGYSNAEILEKLKIIGLDITKQTLNHYFNNPFYAGKIQSKMLDEGMVDGKIEKAVSYEDWLLVQKIMSDRSGKYKHKKRKDNFPLKRFVYCDDCGTPFTAYTVKAKHCDYYKCNKIGCGTNIAAKKLHDSFFSLLKSMDIPMELLTQYESMLRSMVRTNDDENIKHATLLKKQRSEKEKELTNCRRRFATGQFVDEDLYRETVTGLQEEIAAIDAELENYKENLSNLDRKIRDILVTCSKLSVLWRESDLETRQRIQKLTFPHGIFWNNKNHNYRTENRNEVYDLFDRITGSYGNKKETPSEEDVSLCAG